MGRLVWPHSIAAVQLQVAIPTDAVAYYSGGDMTN